VATYQSISKPPPKIQDYKKGNNQRATKEIGLRVLGKGSKKNSPAQPLVSVITIVRNGEKTIERTIRSVLYQNYKNIEYIIIDGGSTDRTFEIIQKYQNQIAYCFSEKDEGIADAFNKGIATSTGELIGLLNSDDWYNENAIKINVSSYLSRPGHILHADMKLILNDKTGRAYILNSNEKSLFYKNNFNHVTMFVPRKIYQEVGLYRLELEIASDYEWLLRAKRLEKKFFYINTVVTNMAVGGVSDSRWIKGYYEITKVKRMYGKSIMAVYLGFIFMVLTGLVSRLLQSLKLHSLDVYLKNKFSKVKRIPA